jgi:RNA polymerase sigma-70 factor, ECF subfamily
MSGPEAGAHDGETMRRSLQQPSVFCDVYRRHFPHIHAFCVTRVGPGHAEDVAQQVFLVAFVHRDKFEFHREDAGPWLCGIARHLVSRHFRIQQRTRLLTRRALPPPSAGAPDVASVERLDAQCLREPLFTAISDLPSSQAETLILHAIADLTHKEIAWRLGIKVGTVKSRLSRAKAHIRERWQPR